MLNSRPGTVTKCKDINKWLSNGEKWYCQQIRYKRVKGYGWDLKVAQWKNAATKQAQGVWKAFASVF